MKEQKVEFKVGKDTLRGSLFIPDGKGPFPGVIFFHGSGGVGEMYFDLAKKISEKGIVGMAFNYRGAGISDGKLENQTIQMGLEDGQAALKFFISQKNIDKNRIGMVGGSFGGFVVSSVFNNLNINSIVLINPASYSPEIIKSINRDSTSSVNKNFRESSSYKNMEKFNGNLLIINSEFDEVLLKGMPEKYFESAINAKRKVNYVLKGARHRISIYPKPRADLEKKIINWFLETL